MQSLVGALPGIIVIVAFVAFFGYTAVRVGPGFVVKRIAGLIFVVIAVTLITFILGNIDPLAIIVQQCGIHCSPTEIQNLANFYNLNLPIWQRYLIFLNGVIHFNLGYSFAHRAQTVDSIIGGGVPVSVSLQVMAISVELIVGIPLGIITALRAGSRLDTTSNSVALLFFAMPTYVLIIFFQLLTVRMALANLPHLPIYGWNGPFSITAIAPVTILALVGVAFFIRLTRTTMLDVLHQDYIRTARAKGLRERTVIYRHALRNALIPLITALAPILGLSVSGAFFTENFFQIPGIAYFAVTSIQNKDIPVIQATVLIASLAIVFMNVVADVTYGILDPRIKVV